MDKDFAYADSSISKHAFRTEKRVEELSKNECRKALLHWIADLPQVVPDFLEQDGHSCLFNSCKKPNPDLNTLLHHIRFDHLYDTVDTGDFWCPSCCQYESLRSYHTPRSSDRRANRQHVDPKLRRAPTFFRNLALSKNFWPFDSCAPSDEVASSAPAASVRSVPPLSCLDPSQEASSGNSSTVGSGDTEGQLRHSISYISDLDLDKILADPSEFGDGSVMIGLEAKESFQQATNPNPRSKRMERIFHQRLANSNNQYPIMGGLEPSSLRSDSEIGLIASMSSLGTPSCSQDDAFRQHQGQIERPEFGRSMYQPYLGPVKEDSEIPLPAAADPQVPDVRGRQSEILSNNEETLPKELQIGELCYLSRMLHDEWILHLLCNPTLYRRYEYCANLSDRKIFYNGLEALRQSLEGTLPESAESKLLLLHVAIVFAYKELDENDYVAWKDFGRGVEALRDSIQDQEERLGFSRVLHQTIGFPLDAISESFHDWKHTDFSLGIHQDWSAYAWAVSPEATMTEDLNLAFPINDLDSLSIQFAIEKMLSPSHTFLDGKSSTATISSSDKGHG